jgi:ABC-type uncharacterized transport system permease subunit
MMTATAEMGDNPLFAVSYFMRLLRVMLLFQVWRMIMQGRAEVSGFSLPNLLTYTLLAEACHDLLLCRTWIESRFWDGTIATRFLRPMGIFGQFAVEWLGGIGFHLLFFSAPLVLLASLLGVSVLPASVASGLLGLLSLILAVLVGLGIEYVFVGFAVAAEIHPYVLNGLRAALGGLLSGAFIPLALLPFGLGRVFEFLPFASQASAPLSLYLGKGEAWLLLGRQVVWAGMLWAFAGWLWRRNRERMVAYGG